MIYKGKAGESSMQIFVDMSFSFLLDYKNELVWIIKEKKTFLAFFGGIIDAEGSFFIRKKQQQANFSLTNYNKDVLLFMKDKMFVFFNIELKFYEETKIRIDRRGYINSDTAKKLLLVRQKKLSNFLKLIAPFILHKNKQKELQIISEFVEEKIRQRKMRS